MLIPGRIFVNGTVRIPVNFQDGNGDDVDPESVVFKLISPSMQITTYTYGTDAALNRSSQGDYFIDVVPNLPGRWHFRWEAQGTNQATAIEGKFVVQVSPFFARSSAYEAGGGADVDYWVGADW